MLNKQGYNFSFDPKACARCQGKCCTGASGNIWLSKDEIIDIAQLFKLNTEEFKKTYCREVRGGYSLKEYQLATNSFACIFFDKEKLNCSIYSHRPEQCRTFPFWPYFKKHPKEAEKECPGVYWQKEIK